MNFSWLAPLADASLPYVIVVGAVACTYLGLVTLAAVLASVHSDPDRRHDARKVLDLLLRAGRGQRRR
ncbi:MAG: hypothetical protein ACRDRK_18805 [Pseudonocardia sp.]